MGSIKITYNFFRTFQVALLPVVGGQRNNLPQLDEMTINQHKCLAQRGQVFIFTQLTTSLSRR